MNSKKTFIISLGGSLIVPKDINFKFLNDFVSLISSYAKDGYKFIIITGGGYTARKYIDIVKMSDLDDHKNMDWVGISSTRLNAELLRVLFKSFAHEHILMNPDSLPETNKPVIVGGGWKPGNSSDLASAHVAVSSGATTVINLSNIDFVYDKDPQLDKNAVPIYKSSWTDFIELLPTEWKPGLSVPFDPVAARFAHEKNLEVLIMNGENLDNLKNYFDGKDFVGTCIKN